MDITVYAKCNECNTLHHVTVTEQDLHRYTCAAADESVQDIWPTMTDADREVLIASRTGHYLCDSCWDACFPEEVYCDVCGLHYDADDPCPFH